MLNYGDLVCALGLGFRQIGTRTYLMMSTAAAVYAVLVGDTDNKVSMCVYVDVSVCLTYLCVSLRQIMSGLCY